MSLIFDISFIDILASLAMICYRLIHGPTLPDRAVAGDQLAIHVVVLIAIYSMSSNQPLLIDLVIVTAIVGFLSIAVIGIYVERGARGNIRGQSRD